jgi:L-aspartate semialdehyde sulfurtransferase ferredoxin
MATKFGALVRGSFWGIARDGPGGHSLRIFGSRLGRSLENAPCPAALTWSAGNETPELADNFSAAGQADFLLRGRAERKKDEGKATGPTRAKKNKNPKGMIPHSMAQVDLTVVASGAHTAEPWIWRFCREFEMKVHIDRATIDADHSWVHMKLDGPVEEIQRATAWLMTTGMHVEATQRAVGA